jgi:hypothetical protein
MELPAASRPQDALLQAWLPRAEAGDSLAMAHVAILRHLSGASPDEINNWLRRAMVSDDAEFLVALGEELVIGTAIHRDLQLARDCFQRALTLSEMKGAYALARFLIGTNRARAEQLLEHASSLGHLPSRQVLMFLRLPKQRIVRFFRRVIISMGLMLQLRKTLLGTTNMDRWWRYQDVFGEQGQLHRRLGDDRRQYFAWARPSDFFAFVVAVVKGDTKRLPRGPIDAATLMPQAPREARIVAVSPPPQAHISPAFRVLTSAGSAALLFWLFSHFSGSLATVPTLRNVPPKAGIQVAMHLKDGSAIFQTLRPDDFVDGTGERTVMLSEPPAKSGGNSRGAFVSLHGFEGNSGSATIDILPFGWTDASLILRIPDYMHCASKTDFGPIADISICTVKPRHS